MLDVRPLARDGPVAQRLEQGTHNPLVPGSNPGGPSPEIDSSQLQFCPGCWKLCLPALGGIVMNQIIGAIEKEQQKADANTFKVGDTVRVHTRVVEGDKERIQIFSGVVIGRKGRGLNETFTVRRISYGEGVERVFPLHSPRIAKIEVEQEGRVRRARLNYLRTRKGKEGTTVRE
jgi:large subunit ribosomal protein L19